MAISMADHFKLQKRSQNFERDSFLTLKEMREFNTNYLPDIFTATCLETGKFYIFNINNEIDETLGKWRELTGASCECDQYMQYEEDIDMFGHTVKKITIGGITSTITIDEDGNIIKNTGSIGGVESTTETDSEGNTYSIVGDKIVSGKKVETTQTTYTDDDGNTVTVSIKNTLSEKDSKKEISTIIIKPDGSSTITKEIINGGGDGVNIGAASGTRTKTEKNSSGVTIKESSEDTSYLNGEEELWATKEDIDNLYSNLFTGFGWL